MIKKEYDFSKYNNKDFIEFYTCKDLYEVVEVEKDNEVVEDYRLVKGDAISREKIYKHEISYIKEVFNSKGNIRTQRVEVGVRHREPIIVLGKYRDIDTCVFSDSKATNMGFKFY